MWNSLSFRLHKNAKELWLSRFIKPHTKALPKSNPLQTPKRATFVHHNEKLVLLAANGKQSRNYCKL